MANIPSGDGGGGGGTDDDQSSSSEASAPTGAQRAVEQTPEGGVPDPDSGGSQPAADTTSPTSGTGASGAVESDPGRSGGGSSGGGSDGSSGSSQSTVSPGDFDTGTRGAVQAAQDMPTAAPEPTSPGDLDTGTRGAVQAAQDMPTAAQQSFEQRRQYNRDVISAVSSSRTAQGRRRDRARRRRAEQANDNALYDGLDDVLNSDPQRTQTAQPVTQREGGGMFSDIRRGAAGYTAAGLGAAAEVRDTGSDAVTSAVDATNEAYQDTSDQAQSWYYGMPGVPNPEEADKLEQAFYTDSKDVSMEAADAATLPDSALDIDEDGEQDVKTGPPLGVFGYGGISPSGINAPRGIAQTANAFRRGRGISSVDEGLRAGSLGDDAVGASDDVFGGGASSGAGGQGFGTGSDDIAKLTGLGLAGGIASGEVGLPSERPEEQPEVPVPEEPTGNQGEISVGDSEPGLPTDISPPEEAPGSRSELSAPEDPGIGGESELPIPEESTDAGISASPVVQGEIGRREEEEESEEDIGSTARRDELGEISRQQYDQKLYEQEKEHGDTIFERAPGRNPVDRSDIESSSAEDDFLRPENEERLPEQSVPEEELIGGSISGMFQEGGGETESELLFPENYYRDLTDSQSALDRRQEQLERSDITEASAESELLQELEQSQQSIEMELGLDSPQGGDSIFESDLTGTEDETGLGDATRGDEMTQEDIMQSPLEETVEASDFATPNEFTTPTEAQPELVETEPVELVEPNEFTPENPTEHPPEYPTEHPNEYPNEYPTEYPGESVGVTSRDPLVPNQGKRRVFDDGGSDWGEEVFDSGIADADFGRGDERSKRDETVSDMEDALFGPASDSNESELDDLLTDW